MARMRRIEGRSEALAAVTRARATTTDPQVRSAVADILASVAERGDAAVRELTERFDGARLDDLRVPPEQLAAAADRVDVPLQRAIRRAIDRVTAYYERQPAEGFLHPSEDGLVGQIVRPLDSVGCYVPAGTAPLFSSLLMAAVPARVAGVERVVAVTPPRADGAVAPEILYVADALGIDEVYRIGGAQAVAALAYGTASIPAVDKVVGPGNAYVVAAKQALFGVVGIESLPGPTETLVVADDRADAGRVAADLLAQAEHHGAQPVLVTTSGRLADGLGAALEDALADLPTAATARSSLDERGLLVVVPTLADAIDVANAYAPEHLCLLVEDPWRVVADVRHAGGIFVGENALEALGDYLAGPSHIMPTGGTARFASFVNLRDFQKVIPVLDFRPEAVREIGPDAARMARAEGLEAHARAIESRLD